jgi:tRNA (cmo5U34)-methyltransferase
MSTRRDTLFADPRERVAPFEFNASVVDVFDDMASRSIPLYNDLLDRCVDWVEQYARPDSVVLDIGCSTGRLFRLLRERSLPSNVNLYGVDSSPEMVQAAMERLADSPHNCLVEARRAEDMVLAAGRVSVAICNYTLQFVDPELRISILRNIRQALQPGGLFVLSEKLTHADPAMAAFLIEHYHAYKRRAGYSDTEIQQKDMALQGVLRPWTLEDWQRTLTAAGFPEPLIAFRWLAFTTFVVRV